MSNRPVWAALDDPVHASERPVYAQVHRACNEERWLDADALLVASPLGETPAGLFLRMQAAEAQGDRAEFGRLARLFDPDADPGVKLWAMNHADEPGEVLALLAARPDLLDPPDVDVLTHALYAVGVTKGTKADAARYAESLAALRPLTPWEARIYAWGLDGTAPLAEAARAYVAAYRLDPDRRIARRLVEIFLDGDDDAQEVAVEFARGVNPATAREPPLIALALLAAAERRAWGSVLRLTARGFWLRATRRWRRAAAP